MPIPHRVFKNFYNPSKGIPQIYRPTKFDFSNNVYYEMH